MKKTLQRLLLFSSLVCLASWNLIANALVFKLPAKGDSVVGHVQWTQALTGDNFSTIGRRYDIGYYELVEANPGVNPDHLAPGTIVVIPSRFILPNVPRAGIVINLAELRIYFYPANSNEVITYPVGIGRQGWDTPLGPTRIIEKIVNPTWNVPDSIRKDRAADGVNLPKSVPPGPANPLGGYAMRLSYATYLMHGTNDYTGIGRRSSSGCIRMLPEDVEALFSKVKVGTRIMIINAPLKAGWQGDNLYLESHVPLSDQANPPSTAIALAPLKTIVTQAAKLKPSIVSWDLAKQIGNKQTGIPQLIGHSLSGAANQQTNF